MTTDFRALCVDLLDEIYSMLAQRDWGQVRGNDDLIGLAFDALAEPLSEPPTDQELRDWHDECADLTLLGEVAHHWASDMRHEDVAAIARAALTKWGKFAPHLPTAKESLTVQNEELPND